MPLPLTAVLDEAANICKLEDLPRWYSHFGGRGIILITFFQSPSQGENVWGREAFKAMVDACSVIWYGGNVDDDAFLSGLVDTVGTHYVDTESRSRPAGFLSGGQASVSSSWQKETIFEKRDLRALPKTRALVTIGGSTPILVRKAFWGNSPFAEAIRQSQRESKHLVPAQQKALPVGESDRADAAATTEMQTEDRADTTPIPVAPTPDTSRADRLFHSEFLTKD
nr:TraG/TraD/VirD4 family protein [Rhodococcus aetherivorans]